MKRISPSFLVGPLLFTASGLVLCLFACQPRNKMEPYVPPVASSAPPPKNDAPTATTFTIALPSGFPSMPFVLPSVWPGAATGSGAKM